MLFTASSLLNSLLIFPMMYGTRLRWLPRFCCASREFPWIVGMESSDSRIRNHEPDTRGTAAQGKARHPTTVSEGRGSAVPVIGFQVDFHARMCRAQCHDMLTPRMVFFS